MTEDEQKAWHMRWLLMAETVGDWSNHGQGVVLIEDPLTMVYFHFGENAISKMFEMFPVLTGHTVYCVNLPTIEDQEMILQLGATDIYCLNEEEDTTIDSRIIDRGNGEFNTEQTQETNIDIKHYKMAMFFDPVFGNCYVKACNLADEMEYAPHFNRWLGDEFRISLKNAETEYSRRKYMQAWDGLPISYRVGLARTELGAINVIHVINAKQHQDVEESPYFIKWVSKWENINI